MYQYPGIYIDIQPYLTQEQIYQYPGIYIDIQPLSDTGADISSYGYRYQT